MISVVDMYRKIASRLRSLEGTPAAVQPCGAAEFGQSMAELARVARLCGMDIVSCAEEIDLRPYGIRPGKCIDDEVIAEALSTRHTPCTAGSLHVSKTKGQPQPACGCVVSRDVGMYDSCLYGCQYCYATKDFDKAAVNFGQHDPNSPSLLG